MMYQIMWLLQCVPTKIGKKYKIDVIINQMKKILIIGLTNLIGGVETYIYNVIKLINKEKYTFDFLIIGQEKKAVFENEINKILGNDKNHFYYAPSLKNNFWVANRWLKEFYDNHHYDAIYLNTTTAARVMYCRYAINKLGAKLIVHSHNGNAISFLKGFKSKLLRHYITKVSWKRLACSEVAYTWMFDDKPMGNVVIPNGIDTNRFKFDSNNRNNVRKDLGIGDNIVVIGHVGRWSPQKNQLYFAELSKILGDKYMFLCLGDGPDKEPFMQIIKAEHIENRFIILGARDDVYKYYSAMDLFAMPSHYEGLPIVAVEAQCNGLSCVLSDKISRQTNISGRCEFVDNNDLEKWADIVRNTKKERFDGENVLKEKGFSVYNTVAMLEKVFDQI